MKITWIVIGASLFVLGLFAGYAIAPFFNTVEVNDEAPPSIEATEHDAADMTEMSAEPTSISMQHLSDAEKGEMMLEIIEANQADTNQADTNPANIQMDDSMPEMPVPQITEEATSTESVEPATKDQRFAVIDTPLHPADGTVRIIESTEGTFIRFEDFSTINGPRLHLYLAKDLGATEFVDLGPIRGTRGNINYRVPDDVDLSEYRYIMHWCVPFRVLFNYVELSS